MHHDPLPYPIHDWMSVQQAVEDGIFYLCNFASSEFTSYDMREKRTRYVVNLPEYFWHVFNGLGYIFVVSKDNFCVLSTSYKGLHSIEIYYTSFFITPSGP